MASQNFEQQKKEVIHKITGILIEALEVNNIDNSQGQKIAQSILVKKETVRDNQTLILFLDQLAIEWPIFKELCRSQKKILETVSKDEQKMTAIKRQLIQLSKSSS